MNDSRLFKATRRTIRAEVTLIIVIVISFSWSAYALYKLALGSSSESIFDFGTSVQSPPSASKATPSYQQDATHPTLSQPVEASNNSQAVDIGSNQLVTASHHQLAPLNLTEQLAIYKNQILKELLARQRKLLLADNDDQPAPSFNEAVALRKQPDALVQQFNQKVALEKQWQPGQASGRARQNVDYLFGGDRRPLIEEVNKASLEAPRQTIDRVIQEERLPLDSHDQLRATTASGNAASNLIQLTDAPSLMQLSKSQQQQRQPALAPTILDLRTGRLRDFGENDESENDEDEEFDDEKSVGRRGRRPELSPNHAVASRQDDLGQLDNIPLTTTTTTTTEMPPTQADQEQDGLETTTLEPARASSTIDDQATTPPPPPSNLNGAIKLKEHTARKRKSRNKKPEVTTASPPPPPQPMEESPKEEDEEGEESSGTNDGGDDDDGSMERVKKTVHAIDEDVDRMTQPSLGMVSQLDKSFDVKNTVHFDDSLPAVIQRDLEHDTRVKFNELSGGLINGMKNRRESRPRATTTALHPQDDLQVADNRVKRPTDVSHASPPTSKAANSSRSGGLGIAKISKVQPEGMASKTGNADRFSQLRRNRRSLEGNLISQTLDALDQPARRAKRRRGNRKSSRRSDEEGNEDEGEEDAEGEEQEAPESGGGGRGQQQQLSDELKSSYQTITSNDPSLQDLLAHKQLLDALQQSQLPAPVTSPMEAHHQNQQTMLLPQQQRLNSSFLEPATTLSSVGRQQSARVQNNKTPLQERDHQHAADTHYSIDHGLLLYPASNEEHEHKSKSKKSKKSSEKKAKKKMTVAVKKGGHKKKKHKKEEKKYLKEKKFKGAKKGKKMSKGKGGKGGKKGKKYYKDKGFKKKGFKNIYVKNEFGQKKSYFDEFRDKDFKKKWKNFDDKYKYAQMKKWQAKDVKGAKKMKDHGEKFKKYDKGKWKKKYHKHQESESAKKKKKYDEF